jgi:L-amino acid N-acyltransferase YncA
MEKKTFQFRLAFGDDFEKMVPLQNQNLATALSDDQKSDGFLSAAFTAEQFKRMSESVAVVVALDATDVIGFVCASTAEFNSSSPLPAAMIARFPEVMIGTQRLDKLKSFVAGPVCVDKNYRGQGVFEGLYAELFENSPVEYQVALALISTANPRSVRAHAKLGMEVVDSFLFAGREFFIVARTVR